MKKLLLLSFLFSLLAFNTKAQLGCVENSLINMSINSSTQDSVWGCDGNCYLNDTIAIYHNGVTHYTFDQCNNLLPACHADFIFQDIAGVANFSDSGTVSAFTPMYLLDFGDGTTPETTIPTTHTYATAGYYTVCLTMYDMLGTTLMCESKSCRVILASGGAGCTAGFTANTVCGVTTFTNGSTGTYTTTEWDFGDLSTTTAGPGDITHTYASPGTYHVILQINDGAGGLCNAGFNDSITVTFPSVAANFSYVASGTGPYTVNFTNTSSGAASYMWDFGDGDTSSAENPVHDYDSCSYTVNLSAIDSNGCISDTLILIDACDISVPTFNSVLNSMSVYPNPAKDNINLLLNSRFNSNVILTVKDVIGRNVVESIPVHLNAGKNNYKLDLPKLPAGVYIIQINDDFGMMNTRVLIK